MGATRLSFFIYSLATWCLMVARITVSAHAADTPTAIDETWLPGGTPTGQAGMHRLLYGHAAAPSGLSFALGADIAAADQLFFANARDRLLISRQTLHVVWTLGRLLEVGLGATSALGADAVFAGHTATSILPNVRLKYNIGTYHSWATGVAASWQAPPLSGSSGVLSPSESTYSGQALGSRKLRHGWELTINIGFTYDNAGGLAASAVTNPVQLFVDGRNATSRIDAGIGIGRLVTPPWPPHILLGPYAELTSSWALRRTHVVDNPMRLSVGSKIFFDAEHRFEADVGVDVRILGAPRYGSVYAGLTPWAIFVAASYHSSWGAWNVGDRQVVYVSQMVREKPRSTVVLSGTVRDTNALILTEARLSIGSDPNTWLSVDPSTGRYQTMVLPVNLSGKTAYGTASPLNAAQAAAGTDPNSPLAIDITCVAPGYITQRQQVQPPAGGGPLRLDFHLQRKAPSALLHIRLFDTVTGAVPHGAQIWLSSADETSDVRLPIADTGELRTTVRPGRYTLFVSAPGYVKQRTQVDLTDDTDFIVHLGMHRRSTGTAPVRPTAPKH